MAINLRKEYVHELDKVLCAEAKSNILSGRTDLVREGANANEILIPKLTVGKMKDYDKSNGWLAATPSVEWETVKADYDRGQKVPIDAVDNIETANLLYAQYASEFIRSEAAPELDAYRFAKYAGTSNIGTTDAAALDTGAKVIAALRAAIDGMNDEGVNNDKVLFISYPCLGLIEDMDSYKSKAVMDNFTDIIGVPQNRFYTAIDLLDGTTEGETSGGYAKADGAKNINFLIVSKSAVTQFDKHVQTDIYSSKDGYIGFDGFLYTYRLVTVARVLDNHVKGVYLHKSTT